MLNGQALPYVAPNASQQQQIASLNRVIDIINGFQNSITFADGSSRRMFIGYMKDGWGSGKDFGIKISKPGVDVMSASESDLLFKMDIETWFWYDANTSKNVMQIGKLVDSTYGFDVVESDYNVAEVVNA